MSRRPGFTLAELFVAILLIGVLAAIAVPVYHRALYRARAGRIVGDFQAVRTAAHAYQARTGRFPADAEEGTVPDGLAPYIEGIEFEGPGYTLDWDNWSVPEGPLVGVSVLPRDPGLASALLGLVGGRALMRLDDRYLYVIASPFASSPRSGDGAGPGRGAGQGRGRPGGGSAAADRG